MFIFSLMGLGMLVERYKFTLVGVGMIAAVFLMHRGKDSGGTDDHIRQAWQQTRAVMWLLAAVVIMLGIISDRIT
jgi:flagellar biosynthesis component FlhA